MLARGLDEGADAIRAEPDAASAALADRSAAPGVRDGAVRERAASVDAAARTRGDYATRVAAQEETIDLPVLPTTTIGSFRRRATSAVPVPAPRPRRDRHRRVRGVPARRDRARRGAAGRARARRPRARRARAQRHGAVLRGAPRRLRRHAARLGAVVWVARDAPVDPVWGDVSRPAPITVDWAVFAQSLTSKPVKGMLTGPVTILAWSFVRDDQPLGETADQVALALRDEIADLEAAGIQIIQVDELALRELLPLSAATSPRIWSGRWGLSRCRPPTRRPRRRCTRTSATRSSTS